MPNAVRRPILMVARGADPVGAGRELEIAAAALHDAGWDVHIAFTTVGGSLPDRLAAAGMRVHAIGARPEPDIAATLRLVGVVRQVRPHTILAWGRSASVLAAAASWPKFGLEGRPRLVCRIAMRPRGLADAWALTRADRVLAISTAVATGCEKAGVSPRRLDTVEPGVAPAAATGLSREAIAARLGLDAAKTWTLCVAPLTASSRLDRLLWGIDQLGVVHRGLEHVLVGSGPQRERLLRRARVQHLAERLRIVPSCDCFPDLLHEVRFVWQSGDVAHGGALFDAMGLGVPTVAVESDAARQAIVSGETGWIVPSLPESELPRRALSLVEDEALAARFGTAAKARAEECFSRARFVSGLLDALQ